MSFMNSAIQDPLCDLQTKGKEKKCSHPTHPQIITYKFCCLL